MLRKVTIGIASCLAFVTVLAAAPGSVRAQSMADTLTFLTESMNDDQQGRHFFLVAQDNPCDVMCGYVVGGREHVHSFLITDVDFDSVLPKRSRRTHDFMKFAAFGRQNLFDYEVARPDGEVLHAREATTGQCIIPMEKAKAVYNAMMHLSMLCRGEGISTPISAE
ncbi:MAG: hypothetical protein Alpg2KO_23450 [Alphaproteobacteria bacterium]